MAMSWDTVKRKIEQRVPNYLELLTSFQDDYHVMHDVYWQGVITNLPLPADGDEVLLDMSRRPHDQVEAWNDVGIIPHSLACSIWVDVQEGGWCLGGALTWEAVERYRMWGFGTMSDWTTDEWIDSEEAP